MKNRYSIGVVFSSLHESCQSLIWKGVMDGSKKNNIDLTVFIGTSQNKINSFFLQYEMLTDMVKSDYLDGLIILSGAMHDHCDHEYIQNFCQQTRPLPAVSISYDVEGFPSILINNSYGIIESVNHLIHEHDCCRIAFIKGPEGHVEAEERYSAYLTALEQNQINFDPSLVFPGDFLAQSGENVVNTIVRDKIEVDAIVTVDDQTAFGVIEGLRNHRDDLEKNIAVIGFDDVAESKIFSPSLTTVRQPLEKMGHDAVTMLLQQLDDQIDEQKRYLSTEFITRQSCGCLANHLQQVLSGNRELKEWPVETTNENIKEKIAVEFASVLAINDVSNQLFVQWGMDLLEKLLKDLKEVDGRNYFLSRLNELLPNYKREGGDLQTWQQALTAIIDHKELLLDDFQAILQADSLFHKARILVSEEILKDIQYNQTIDELKNVRIRDVIQQIITTYNFDELLSVIAERLPELGVNSCYLVLYKNNGGAVTSTDWKLPGSSRLVLAVENGQSLLPKGEPVSFNTVDLLPEEIETKRKDKEPLIYMPLFFEEEHFGYINIGYAAEEPLFLYEELRIHISSAIKSSYILKELKALSLRDELTGLYNRRGFISLGETMCSKARLTANSLTLFYIDMDYLKSINDIHGHHEGDWAIRKVGALLRESLREQDIIARLGGDEFTVLAFGVDKTLEPKILNRIEEQFDKFNNSSEKPYKLSISIGSSIFDVDNEVSFEKMMSIADEEMMTNKRKSRET